MIFKIDRKSFKLIVLISIPSIKILPSIVDLSVNRNSA